MNTNPLSWTEESLKADLDKYMDERMAPIRQKMIAKERQEHKTLLKEHQKEGKEITKRNQELTKQIITIEGVLFGAIIVFLNSEKLPWSIILSLALIILSMIFGFWSQSLSISSSFWWHSKHYGDIIKNDWWTRELWGDETVKAEKEVIGSHVDEFSDKHEKYELLELLHLDADKVDCIFKGTFITSLISLFLNVLIKLF